MMTKHEHQYLVIFKCIEAYFIDEVLTLNGLVSDFKLVSGRVVSFSVFRISLESGRPSYKYKSISEFDLKRYICLCVLYKNIAYNTYIELIRSLFCMQAVLHNFQILHVVPLDGPFVSKFLPLSVGHVQRTPHTDCAFLAYCLDPVAVSSDNTIKQYQGLDMVWMESDQLVEERSCLQRSMIIG
ncbi:hypothetical protein AGLY_011668 [Aphis glycines]|uniref:Uncharacterized protein n=1 Tax=Aphis glycines TaxID=307491 RepID=A0A6G0TB11_APHGL|nr:hypothetical protein AGLY_011668 [Aphis glycines]